MGQIAHWLMKRIKTVHFIGVGGIGMSGLAEILTLQGFEVQGSDLRSSEKVEHLRDIGVQVFIGHDAAHLKEADVVVYSSAVTEKNPEMKAARENKIPVIRRAELLAELMRLHFGIAVAGTHGKTTTTSIIAHLLDAADVDPTVVIGGNANNFKNNVKIGDGEYFVAEADESDSSFLLLAPVIAVVTNVEEEHVDHYKSMRDLYRTFAKFLQKVPFFGNAVVCGDDKNVQMLIEEYSRSVLTYGFGEHNDLQASNLRVDGLRQFFIITYKGKNYGEFEIHVPGKHMVLNSLAALGVLISLEIDLDIARSALPKYSGVQRRMDIKGEVDGVLVIDDYAHHPTEIQAALTAIRSVWKRPITAVFQPHRYSRTERFKTEFAKVLSQVDRLILLPVYAASELPTSGLDLQSLAQFFEMAGNSEVWPCETVEAAAELLKNSVTGDEIIVTLGAGNVFQVGELFLELTKKN